MIPTRDRWICCQIGAREHYAVPRALLERDALQLLLTDVWMQRRNPLGMLGAGLRGRFHPKLATEDVYAPNFSSIAFEMRAKLERLDGWNLIIARNQRFQDQAIRRLSKVKADPASLVVMAYSYAARDIFKFARSRGWRTVLAQIDPGIAEERIVADLHKQSPSLCGQFKLAPAEYWSSWQEECRLADRIVVNSHWSFQNLSAEGIATEKIRIIPLAYETRGVPNFLRRYPAAFTPARPLRVLFLGQVNLRKGIAPLIDAIRLLRGEPIEFTFVGPVQISIPQDLQGSANVHWVGAVPHVDAARFYREADAFIFPTFSDGFGLTQLECQAWSLPIITTHSCGEVVEADRNGLLLSDATSSEIAGSLRRVLADPAYLQTLSQNSSVPERFGLLQVGEKWLRVFE